MNKIGGGKLITVNKNVRECHACGLFHSADIGAMPEECGECDTSLTPADHKTQVPAINCSGGDHTLPLQKDTRNTQTRYDTFICHFCDGSPIVAARFNREYLTLDDIFAADFSNLHPQEGVEIEDGVYVTEVENKKQTFVTELLNLEGKTYDERFNTRSITADDTSILLVYTGEEAIGYLTWTEEMGEHGNLHPRIQQVFIRQSHWGQGISEALLEYALDELPQSSETVQIDSPNIYMMRVLYRAGLIDINKNGEQPTIAEQRISIEGNGIEGRRKFLRERIEES